MVTPPVPLVTRPFTVRVSGTVEWVGVTSCALAADEHRNVVSKNEAVKSCRRAVRLKVLILLTLTPGIILWNKYRFNTRCMIANPGCYLVTHHNRFTGVMR